MIEKAAYRQLLNKKHVTGAHALELKGNGIVQDLAIENKKGIARSRAAGENEIDCGLGVRNSRKHHRKATILWRVESESERIGGQSIAQMGAFDFLMVNIGRCATA
jgi:hypothetical protein